MPRKKVTTPRQSGAALVVEIQSDHHAVEAAMTSLRDRAESIAQSDVSSKRQKKMLLDTAVSLLELHSSVTNKIPQLVPEGTTQYSVSRLTADKKYAVKSCTETVAPRDNLRTRTFDLDGISIPYPKNKVHYSAVEACKILFDIEQSKSICLSKVVGVIIKFIPSGRSTMFRVLKTYRNDPDVEWPKKGRPPILSNSSFLSSIKKIEKDENRAVSTNDMKNILKGAKEDIARSKQLSIMTVVTPSKSTRNNYMSLLPQLDVDRSCTSNVQQKSEARYIAETSFRNAISHIMAVSVAHYQVGNPDPRIKKIDQASDGSKKLYEMIKKENNGSEITVVLPFFIVHDR